MRVIKFRAWDRQKKKMYEVYAIDWSNGVVISCHLFDEKNAIKVYPNEKMGDQIDLLQFIGLFDKNGKEIFEGDILHWEKTEEGLAENFEVVWEEKQACFATKIVINKPIFSHFNTGYLEAQTPAEDLEVIGNIYKNPELLK